MASSSSISKAEKSYIQAGFLQNPPSRADGRTLSDFRTISLETGVAPLANGSARLSIGRNPHNGSGGTEVLAAAKLEVESVEPGSNGVEGGRMVCSVTCSPAAYPYLSAPALDDLQYDLTTVLHDTLSHRSLHPRNLGILRGGKSAKGKAWLLHLDLVVLVDSGNIYDALFMAARAALCDTRVPRTRSVAYKARRTAAAGSSVVGAGVDVDADAQSGTGGRGDMDVDEDAVSGFDTRQLQTATDFELPDYWDEGELLDGQQQWPLCVTLNVIHPMHYLDATTVEEASTPIRLLLIFSFDQAAQKTYLQGMRTLGNGEVTTTQIAELMKHGEKYAKDIWNSLNLRLKEDNASKLKERTKF